MDKNFVRTFCSVCFIFCLSTRIFSVTSVYVCPNWGSDIVSAYKVNGTSLTLQDNSSCLSGTRSVGMGIDLQKKWIFVPLEFTNHIDVIDAKNLQRIDTLTIANTYYPSGNLVGITGTSNGQFYVVERYTNRLWSLSYNNSSQIWEYDFANPYYITLSGLQYDPVDKTCGAFGIALDETNGLLYVADNTTTVKAYDTSDWSHVSTSDVTVSHHAIGVANQYLYTGSIDNYGQGSQKISLYDIAADFEYTLNTGSSVVGIAVDQSTSLVYVTTSSDGAGPMTCRLIVYAPSAGPSLTQQWISDWLGWGPSALAVVEGVYYKPAEGMTLEKTDNVASVSPTDEITYTITYDPNDVARNNVTITDFLPAEVDYDDWLTDPCYHIATHSYTWPLGDLGPTASGYVQLTVTVNELAKPAGVITNRCEIESDLYYKSAQLDTPVACWNTNPTIFVDDSASGNDNGTSAIC